MRRPRSIQGRLLGLLLAGVAAVWIAAAAFTWIDVRHELDELLDAHLAQAAALLVVQQVGELEHDDDRTLDAPSLHRYAPRAVFQVFHEGHLALRSADAPLEPLVDAATAGEGFTSVGTRGVAWRVFATRGRERDVQVFVGERMDAREHIVRVALWGTLWPLALALPLLAVLAWWAIRRGLAPLRALGVQLAARPADAAQPVAIPDPPAEIVPMLGALNDLFGRIETMRQAERRFTADAAHELRTPIAAIRAQAQVALAEADDDARRRHALRATLEGCDRAARLVDQLLTLARLEAGAAVAMQAVDLHAVARQVVGDLAPQAMRRQQDLGLDAEPCVVSGNATLLAVLLRNLVDNALRYSPAGAHIEVTLRAVDGGAVLQVEDSGPGLSADRAQRLGLRFERGPGHEQSGSGLGWSIVQRIAQAHGFETSVGVSQRLGGLAVTVTTAGVSRGSPASRHGSALRQAQDGRSADGP